MMISGNRPGGISSAHDVLTGGRGRTGARPGGKGRSETGAWILEELAVHVAVLESTPERVGLVADAAEELDEGGPQFPTDGQFFGHDYLNEYQNLQGLEVLVADPVAEDGVGEVSPLVPVTQL